MHIVFNITERIVSGSTQRLEASVKLLHEKVDRIMAKITDVDVLLDQLNTATNDVAADLKDLRDQIVTAPPVSQAQLDAVATRLSANVARLQVLAADPANPIPAVDPNPPVPANG